MKSWDDIEKEYDTGGYLTLVDTHPNSLMERRLIWTRAYLNTHPHLMADLQYLFPVGYLRELLESFPQTKIYYVR